MSSDASSNSPSHLVKRASGLFAGAFAGGFAKTFTAPFDRVKILCQTGKAPTPISAVKQVWTQEGMLGFWRGNLASLLRIIPNRGVLFMCSDFIKDMMRGFQHYPPNVTPPPLNGLQYVCAGSLSGAVTVIATYPLDLIRGRLTGTVGAGSRYKSISQTFMLTIREEGARALYRGMSVSLIGAFPYEGIRFGVYDTLKSHYITHDSPIYHNVVIGACSGLAAATVLYPNDTVRRRIQVQHKFMNATSGEPFYKNGWECYKSLYRNHGVSIFYRGLSANLIRVVPSAALQFGCFEFIKKELAQYNEKSKI